MKKEAIYIDNQLIVTNDDGTISGPYEYSDNIVEMFQQENKLEELKEELKILQQKKEKYSKSNNALTPILCGALGPLIISTILYINPNLFNELYFKNDLDSFINTLIKEYVVVLPISALSSIMLSIGNKRTKAKLKDVMDKIYKKSVQIEDIEYDLKELYLGDNLDENELDNYDVIDIKTATITPKAYKLKKNQEF